MDKRAACAEYFLGANTAGGFGSLFSGVYQNEPDWLVYIIKGGPGTGKSTLMRRVCEEAERRGEFYEKIYCSSDPSSLDAVILPLRRRAIFDGTAPHVLEPKYPGATENLVSLCSCWSKSALFLARGEIKELSSACTLRHKNAQRLLLCADAFTRNSQELALSRLDFAKIDSQAQRIVKRFIPKGQGGRRFIRLLSALTPNGVRFFDDTIYKLCDTIIPIRDIYKAPSALLLQRVAELAEERQPLVKCVCSQDFSQIEHLIFPELRLCLTTQNGFHCAQSEERAIRGERFITGDFQKDTSRRMRENAKLRSRCIAAAQSEMLEAKWLHDELEKIYISAMDFGAVNEAAERCAGDIFSV